MVIEINDKNFNQEVIDSDKTVVVDFWAAWCGPCKMLAPVIEQVDAELGGQVKFVKVNVDENPVTSSTYRIASIPSLLVFKNGEVVETIVGFRPKEEIISIVKNHI